MPRYLDPEAHFWSKVDTWGGGCWRWIGAHNQGGYGLVGVNGRLVTAHRRAYELVVGSIPHGLVLDHLCRVRDCCKPFHLEPVTQAENLRRIHKPRFLVQASCDPVPLTYY